MRKVFLCVAAFLLVMVTLPLSASCEQVIDSRSYDDGTNSWCWLSGLICYYCWGTTADENCANDWEPCDVTPPKKGPHPVVVEARPRPVVASPCAVKTPEPAAQQVQLAHVL